MVWVTFLVLQLPEVAVVLVGLVLAVVRRRTLRGRAAGLAVGGFVTLLLALTLIVALTVALIVDPDLSSDELTPFTLVEFLDSLLYTVGLALVTAAVFAGRGTVAAPDSYAGWGAPTPPAAGGWTPPQQAQPADWTSMSGVWSMPRDSFDQPPRP